MFAFVRARDDYKLYFIMTVGTVALNALVNSVHVRKLVRPKAAEYFSLRYLKQNCVLGTYSVMGSMYLTFNVMFLGLMSGNAQVGYYTTAFKVYMVVLGVFSAFTNVMIPRMSALLAEGEKSRFQELAGKSFRAMCTFSLPLIACSMILAPQIIYVLAGAGYEGAVTPMRIIMPAALFVGIAQVLAMQVLVPMKKDRTLFAASVAGAAASIAINMTLVPALQSTGSAVVLLCSEIAVTTVYVVYITRNGIVEIPFGSIGRNLLMTVPVVAVCLICERYVEKPFALVVLAAIGLSLVCFINAKNNGII